jgi:hypothetical protein
MVICTPGTAAPEGSMIVPTMVASCADATNAKAIRSEQRRKRRNNLRWFMFLLEAKPPRCPWKRTRTPDSETVQTIQRMMEVD